MLNLLIKPASGLCNMRCEYCFYRDESENREAAFKGFMTDETAEILIRKTFEKEKRDVLFAFQGGEPTLVGLDFYKKFTDNVKRYKSPGMHVSYSLQTNGLLVDKRWAKFFAENHFLIGLSCDGSEALHNSFRKDVAGKGTFSRVMGAVKTMKRYGVEYNVLTVVTPEVARHISDVYVSLKKYGVRYMQFIPCLNPLNCTDVLPQTLGEEDYLFFLRTLFHDWFEDFRKGEYYSIRYFDNLVFLYNGNVAEQCGMQGHCNIQYVVEGNGDVYPCDFYCLDEYLLGNLRTDSIDSLAASASAQRFMNHSVGFDDDCKKCNLFSLCRSGCRRYKRDGKYLYCNAAKKFLSEFKKRMPEINSILKSGLYHG